MQVFYSDCYELPLPPGHRFPIEKYRMVRERLLKEGILGSNELHESPLAQENDVLRAHDRSYFEAVRDGYLSAEAIRRIGFPYSHELYLRSMASVGGCVEAARASLRDGIAGSLSGGTHHAHRAHGEGYCVFNDIAVAALTLLEEKRVRRVAIVDLDVHQGNGNSSILGDHPGVLILSLHGEKNYPFVKVPSTLDLAFPDGTGDDGYLSQLRAALPLAFLFEPEIVFYQMGVDGLKEDRLGKLALTHAGLIERDRIVLSACKSHAVPITLCLGGGYAKPIERSVDAYVNTYRVVREVYGRVETKEKTSPKGARAAFRAL